MSYIGDKILALSKQLFPTGRAWRLNLDGYFENLFKGLQPSEEQFYNDAVSTLNSILPDNDDFTEEDATDWERRLGMITADGVSLEDRKLAIIRKMNFPGVVAARQAATWIEKQLQDAGFNVYVFENIPALPPEDVSIYGYDFIDDFNFGMFNFGQVNFGGGYNNLVANNLVSDLGFDLGDNLKCTFYVCGETKGLFADVPAARELEFRQLILRTKPAQTVAFLLINYV